MKRTNKTIRWRYRDRVWYDWVRDAPPITMVKFTPLWLAGCEMLDAGCCTIEESRYIAWHGWLVDRAFVARCVPSATHHPHHPHHRKEPKKKKKKGRSGQGRLILLPLPIGRPDSRIQRIKRISAPASGAQPPNMIGDKGCVC